MDVRRPSWSQEEKSMKHIGALIAAAAALVLLAGCMSLDTFFPGVNEPVSIEASLLVLEAGRVEHTGSSEPLSAAEYSAWVPWVEDASGRLVEFRHITSVSKVDSVMYRENLNPGTYVLKGFIHVYTDFSKLDSEMITQYGPYQDYPHDVKQFFLLDNPVRLQLQPGRMDSFGRYFISFQYHEGFAGSSDDRYRVIPESFAAEADPRDRRVLQVMKHWTASKWTLWNQRNPEEAVDY